MKKILIKSVSMRSVLSGCILGLFVLISTGSLEDLGFGEINSLFFEGDITDHFRSYMLIGQVLRGIEGGRDEYGNSHGETEFSMGENKGEMEQGKVDMDVKYSETSQMKNGLRHGETRISNAEVKTLFFIAGIYAMISSEDKSVAEISAHQVLKQDYPYLWYKFVAFGFNELYLESYMDTLEYILGTFEFEAQDFDEYFDDAVDVLGDTPYDSIIQTNTLLSLFRTFEVLKKYELRMAIIDRYREGGSSTFNMIQSRYPGYLNKMKKGELNTSEFEEFCYLLDSCMSSSGSLDVADINFLDSVDSRMYRALDEVSAMEKSAASFKDSFINNEFRTKLKSIKAESAYYANPGDVAEVVYYYMFVQFLDSDLIRTAVKKSWYLNNDVAYAAVAGTEFVGVNSGTSVTLKAYVFDDGGASIASRGLVWAQTYNPTIEDNIESSGTGIGESTLTLEGLIEGETYYARAFAVNIADTVYGNCIKFVATDEASSDISEEELSAEMIIWPNPSNARANLSFWIDTKELVSVIIIGMNGQVVYQKDLGVLSVGQNMIELDLSGISEGAYHCLLKVGNQASICRKLVIAK